jgi:uncharacterized membrane protein
MARGVGGGPAEDVPGRVKVLVSFAVGSAVAAMTAAAGHGRAAPLVGWDVSAAVFCAWVGARTLPMNPGATAAHAKRENPGRDLVDVILLGAAAASLIAVGVVLFGAGHADGNQRYVLAGFALASVLVSWTLVHTVFALKYALLYYSVPVGGIDFPGSEPPDYPDFAYLSFTIGMTFQVSDTDITVKAIRRTALRQALMAFPFGTFIIAGSINLVSGLAK